MDKRQTLLISLALAAALVFGPGLAHQLWLSWKQYKLDRELRNLQAAHQALVKEHERLTSDSVYVEGLIRSTFKVAKPGELVVPLTHEDRNQ